MTVQVYEGDGERPPPSTVADAVKRLASTLTAEQLNDVRKTKKDDLISLHFSFGMWIRNNFGLWTGNDALINDAAPMIPPPEPQYLKILGKDYAKKPHPDDVSMVIIYQFWESLQ